MEGPLDVIVLLILGLAFVYFGLMFVESIDGPFIAIPATEKVMEIFGFEIKREQIHHVPYT